MQKILVLFILLFSSSVFAEDISDFEIEGMSVGDSLLDYMTEEKIKKEIEINKYMYEYLNNTTKFGEVYILNGENFKTYRKRNTKEAKKLGMHIVDYILTAGEEINTKEYREYPDPDGPVKAVSYAPAGVGGGLTPNNQFDLTNSY